MTILRCNNCHLRLTPILNELSKTKDYHSIQNEEYIVKGRFYENHEMEKGFYLLNISDCEGLEDHKEKRRFSGCCGPSPDGELNKICNNCNSEIGRETTDCLTPHYTKIKTDKVTKESDPLGFFNILCHPFSMQIGDERLKEIEALYQYSDKSTALEILVNEVTNLEGDVPPEISL